MKRFLKVVAILALFFVVIAYVAFRVVFFDPFGGPRASLDPLVPKDVDVMVRRKELAKDFEPFPMPRFFKTLLLKDEWESLTSTRVWRELEPKLGIGEVYEQLERIPGEMQPLDLMKDLAGREAMLVGRWRQDGSLAWAAIARGSFKAKLGVEAVRFGFARKLAGDRIGDYAEKEGVHSVSAEGRRWHLARSEDALIAGNDFDLVRAIVALDEEGGTESLDRSPQYRAAVLSPPPFGRPIDFVIDVAAACRHLGIAWPAPAPHDPMALKFARELLVPDRFAQAMGRVALGNQIELATIVAADRVALRPAAGGLLDGGSAKLAELHQFCGKVFPNKVAVCGYVRLEVKEFLRRIESLLEPDERQLLNDFVVNLKSGDQQFQPKSTVELLDTFAGIVTDEFAFAVEPDEPYHVPGTEEGEMQFPDPHWGPRVAFVFPVTEKAAASQFLDRLIKALSTRQNAISNIWRWSYKDLPWEFREIKSIDTDLPTISIGMIELQKRDCIVITTTGAFLNDIVQQKAVADAGANAGLQSELHFKQAAEALPGYGQGFVYVSSPSLRKVLAELCVVWAEQLTRPDWTIVRRDLERRILATKHPDLAHRYQDESVRKQIEPEVDREITEREQEWKTVTLPQKTEELQRNLDVLEMARWLVLSMRVDERDLELKLRLATPANFGD